MCEKLKCGAICGKNKKFTVLKDEDINKYLTETEKAIFNELRNKIMFSRRDIDGKSSNNEYMVINKDEPYANKVIEIMKKHGHAE